MQTESQLYQGDIIYPNNCAGIGAVYQHLCVISVVVGYLASSAYVRRKKRMRALEGRDVDL